MFKCYADGCCVDTVVKEAKTAEEAKEILTAMDEVLSDDYSEMWVVNTETGEEIEWLDFLEGAY